MLNIRSGNKYRLSYNGNSFDSLIKVKDNKYYARDDTYHMDIVFTDDSIKRNIVKVSEFLHLKH